MRINHTIEYTPNLSLRARQCASMFDVAPDEKMRLNWSGDVDLDFDWQVGLIVGPSGCGKSTLALEMFGSEAMAEPKWSAPCILDDFGETVSLNEITQSLGSVGFNTIPAWLRPFHVLSNGEQFRATIARRLVEGGELVVVDEFTSVVDRQVAKCASNAVQKHVRRDSGRKLVAVTCHYDVQDWLQPDWILEPATMSFRRRSVQSRPRLEGEIRKVGREVWALFAPHHYLTAKLPSSCHCWALFIEGRPVAFTGAARFPHGAAKNIWRVARTVVLPDWQGLGLSFHLNNQLGSAFKSQGWRFRNYPASPGFIRAHASRSIWKCVQAPGQVSKAKKRGAYRGRSCAVFEYQGPSMDRIDAAKLLRLEQAAGGPKKSH